MTNSRGIKIPSNLTIEGSLPEDGDEGGALRLPTPEECEKWGNPEFQQGPGPSSFLRWRLWTGMHVTATELWFAHASARDSAWASQYACDDQRMFFTTEQQAREWASDFPVNAGWDVHVSRM